MNPNISKTRRAKSAQSKTESSAAAGSKQHNGADQGGHRQLNVGETERQLSMIGGTVLAVCGLLRGSISGLAMAAIGGALIWRGHTGHCDVYQMLGHSSAEDSVEQDNKISHDAEHRKLSHAANPTAV